MFSTRPCVSLTEAGDVHEETIKNIYDETGRHQLSKVIFCLLVYSFDIDNYYCLERNCIVYLVQL